MSEENIKVSINSIEPEAGAKERMYQNILKKAQQQQAAPAEGSAAPKKKLIRYARFVLPIAACFCLLIIGITRFIPENTPADPDNGEMQAGNPFAEVEGSEDFKDIGITLDAPADAQNVSYVIIDNEIAEICFERDGKSFVARASAQSGDFSGLNGIELSSENVDAANSAVIYAIQTEEQVCYKLLWTNGKVYYCLYGIDGADKDQVLSAYEALKK